MDISAVKVSHVNQVISISKVDVSLIIKFIKLTNQWKVDEPISNLMK